MNRVAVIELIVRHEGKRSQAYKDTRGISTVGIGFNLETASAPTRIAALGVDYADLCAGKCELTENHIAALFALDLDEAIAAAESIVPNFDEHPDDIQYVIVDMIFNLGPAGFAKFKKTIEAFKAKDYVRAATEMANSKWAEQVPNRATEDIDLVHKHSA